jgi:hypothetical protein
MRIDIHAINFELSEPVERFAESRVWLAARRYVSRVAWIGVWLANDQAEALTQPMTCRIDAWLRGLGHITIEHADTNIFSAVDIAAARLEQSIGRALHRAAERGISAALDNSGLGSSDKPAEARVPMPRMAVVIERRDAQRRLPLLPWLRIKHGIEQVSRITLPPEIWDAIAPGASASDQLQQRLALSLLCRPELIVVLGRAREQVCEDDERRRVRSMLRLVGSASVPVPAIGVWIREQWEPDCRVQSLELSAEETEPQTDDRALEQEVVCS